MCTFIDPREQLIRIIEDLLIMDSGEVQAVLRRQHQHLRHGLDVHWGLHDAAFLAIMTEAEKKPLRGLPCWTHYAEELRKALAAVETMR